MNHTPVIRQTDSAEQTVALGRELGATLLPPSGLVLLVGNLGAGKTTVTKGIAEGRGAVSEDEVSSPTFTLIHEYGDPPRLYHVDLYRLDEAREVAALGLDEILDRDALVLIEWGERFPELWPVNRTEIHIKRREGSDQRTFDIRLAKDS
jgi:tRNA threonylcarbamoyladenosine biosynthesis protein TsaE